MHGPGRDAPRTGNHSWRTSMKKSLIVLSLAAFMAAVGTPAQAAPRSTGPTLKKSPEHKVPVTKKKGSRKGKKTA